LFTRYDFVEYKKNPTDYLNLTEAMLRKLRIITIVELGKDVKVCFCLY